MNIFNKMIIMNFSDTSKLAIYSLVVEDWKKWLSFINWTKLLYPEDVGYILDFKPELDSPSVNKISWSLLWAEAKNFKNQPVAFSLLEVISETNEQLYDIIDSEEKKILRFNYEIVHTH